MDPQTQILKLHASAGLYTHLDGDHASIPVGQYKIGRIAQVRKPHLTNDVQEDPEIHDQEWAKREGMVAFAGYPIIVQQFPIMIGFSAVLAIMLLKRSNIITRPEGFILFAAYVAYILWSFLA